MLVSVPLTVELATANLLDGAALTHEVLLLSRLGKLQVALAVCQAAIIRLLARGALVEGALGQEVLIRLVVKLAACFGDGRHVDFPLGLKLPSEC